MAKKKFIGFGALTDDPTAIANRAIREAQAAIRDRDALGFRQAANKGWLAVSSAADVAADRLGQRAPGGSVSRLQALVLLEREAKLRRGTLVGTFESAKRTLHGECFHGDLCPSERGLLGILDSVRDMTVLTKQAMGKLPKRKRGC